MNNNIPRVDFHIHTHYLKCANDTMQVPDIVKTCAELGVTAIGITDHLNTLDKVNLHRLILNDIKALDAPIPVYFGVELNYMSKDGEFAYNEEVREEYGFQFAIGGIHNPYAETYDLRKIIDIQHRHHLDTCRNPLVDVLVHPYWFARGVFNKNEWPWFDSMKPVPESYARELGQTARETGTAIEINATACLTNPNYSDKFVREYIDFMAVIAETGAMFSLSSDAHSIQKLAHVERAWEAAAQIGLTPERIWKPACKPVVGPGSV